MTAKRRRFSRRLLVRAGASPGRLIVGRTRGAEQHAPPAHRHQLEPHRAHPRAEPAQQRPHRGGVAAAARPTRRRPPRPRSARRGRGARAAAGPPGACAAVMDTHVLPTHRRSSSSRNGSVALGLGRPALERGAPSAGGRRGRRAPASSPPGRRAGSGGRTPGSISSTRGRPNHASCWRRRSSAGQRSTETSQSMWLERDSMGCTDRSRAHGACRQHHDECRWAEGRGRGGRGGEPAVATS